MDHPYFYAEIKRANGSSFFSIDGSFVSSIRVCSTRMDQTDYAPLTNPLPVLSTAGGFSALSVDFRPSTLSESLAANIIDKTTSDIGYFDFSMSGIYSGGNISTRNWLQAINDLNGQDIFQGAIIRLYLCNGVMAGAVYAGSDSWEDPTGETSTTLTIAEWPYHRNDYDSSDLLFVGVIRSIKESGTELNFECDSWDCLLDKRISKTESDNSSNSSINANPVIFGTAIPGVDGDHCACFPASQGANNRSGTSFKISALPLYDPASNNICILDEKSGYAGVNIDAVKINSDTNELTIAADTDATTLVSRTNYQDWNLTQAERAYIVQTLGYTLGARPDNFKELPMFVNGEQIKIHTPTTNSPTSTSSGLPGGGALAKVLPSDPVGGIVSRGWGDTDKKAHATSEVYAHSDAESGIYLRVRYRLPVSSMDDKNTVEPFDYPFASSLDYSQESRWGDNRGDKGDFWDVVRNSKYIDSPTQESKNIEFGNHLYVAPNGNVEGLPIQNGWILFIRPEELESDERDQIISVKSSILFEMSSIGDDTYTTTTDAEGESKLFMKSGLNLNFDYGDDYSNEYTNGLEEPTGIFELANHKYAEFRYNYALEFAGVPWQYFFPQKIKGLIQARYVWSFTPSTDDVTFLFGRVDSDGLNTTTNKQTFDTLETDYEVEGVTAMSLDNIGTRGSDAAGNWFSLKITAISDKVDDELYHHSLKLFKILFNIEVRKYLADYRVYSIGYGAKLSSDDSLIEDCVDAVSEIITQFETPITVTNSMSGLTTDQIICGASSSDDTVRSLIADIAKSSLVGIVYGADGSIYDFAVVNSQASSKTITEDDLLLSGGMSSIVFGMTDVSQLKTSVKLNFRQNPASGDYTASLYADSTTISDFTGRRYPIADINYLYDQDYWINISKSDLTSYCNAFSQSYYVRNQYDQLEFNAPWLRDRETAERVFSDLVKLSTNQRTIITFQGLLESFYQVKQGDVVDFDLTATDFDDRRMTGKRFRVKKKILNCNALTYTITVEQILQ
jgi:hypothetical protein